MTTTTTTRPTATLREQILDHINSRAQLADLEGEAYQRTAIGLVLSIAAEAIDDILEGSDHLGQPVARVLDGFTLALLKTGESYAVEAPTTAARARELTALVLSDPPELISWDDLAHLQRMHCMLGRGLGPLAQPCCHLSPGAVR